MTTVFRIAIIFKMALLAIAAVGDVSSVKAQEELAAEVAQVFKQHCLNCHNARDRAGGLSLSSGEGLLTGGESGGVIEPGNAEASYLIELITSHNGRAAMPQDAPALSEDQVNLIRRWIEQGARWPADLVLPPPTDVDTAWWSLQPLDRPAIPIINLNQSPLEIGLEPLHPIDAFVLAELQKNQLTFSHQADRRTLARRLYFDLIGLPPGSAELDAFENDIDPRAYENLVDRLLASPRYGERWARHWLDVVHYADTHGFDKDKVRPNSWPYRDYVIRAFNEDKPWRQFIQEQVAGDVMFPHTVDGIEALGLLAAGPWDFIGHEELPESKIDGKVARHLDRDDMVRNTVQTFTSLTVGCAQCHHHKFDPITQTEYYRLQAVFAALDRADKPYDVDPETARQRQSLLAKIAELELNRASAEVNSPSGNKIEIELAVLNQQLADLPEPSLVYAGTVHHGSGNFQGRGPWGGIPRAIFLLHRGEVTSPREAVSPAALAIVPGLSASLELPPDHTEGERRAALAKWLADSKNTFTWRSVVNRVWQYHFGIGLVDTPNDFGQMGGQPRHPELLDWLACEFRDGPQSLKSLHRLIVTSHTYRQTSEVDPNCVIVQRAKAIDTENRLLWRARRRKLDAESIRDSVLAISGQLDLTMGGPGFQDFVIEKPEHSPQYRYELHDHHDRRSYRRSIYRLTVRSQMQPLMTALDCADPSQQVARRNEGESPLQALALLNNGLILALSEHYADKLLATHRPPDFNHSVDRLTQNDLMQMVAGAFRETTSRWPSEDELKPLVAFAAEHGLPNLCRVLFNLNEFLFVD